MEVVDGQLLQMSTLHDIQALSSNASALFQDAASPFPMFNLHMFASCDGTTRLSVLLASSDLYCSL